MTTEQRVLIASALSAIVLVIYSQTMPKRAVTPRSEAPAATAERPAMKASGSGAVLPRASETEPTIHLMSSTIHMEVGASTATVRAVVLRDYKDVERGTALKFGKTADLLRIRVSKESDAPWSGEADGVPWSVVNQSEREVVWERRDPLSKEATKLTLTLDDKLPIYRLEVVGGSKVSVIATWDRGDSVKGQYNNLEALVLTNKDKPWQRQYLKYGEGATQPKHVPRGTSLVTLSERFFAQAIKPDNASPASVTLLPTPIGTVATLIESKPDDSSTYTAEVYIGPRDFFKLREAGFEQAFPLGILAKIGLIFMLLLKWISSVVHSYGIGIIVLSVLITAMLSPFTMISFKSMRKMQALQPKMDQLKKKYEKDPQKLNQEMLALFREHKVSPMSGCLPMLLQMPIFFALLSAIPHFVDLRGASFLWIKDLSLPDRLAKLPIGLDLNLLPILMAGAMYVQQKMTQRQMPSNTPNIMSGPLMSVLFGVMFYTVPSCLVLYWLTNSLVSAAIFKMSKT